MTKCFRLVVNSSQSFAGLGQLTGLILVLGWPLQVASFGVMVVM